MSKTRITFKYPTELHSQVKHMQKGPVVLDNIYDSFVRPEYRPISLPQPDANSNHNIPIDSKMNSKPSSPPPPPPPASVRTLMRVRSEDNLKLPPAEDMELIPQPKAQQLRSAKKIDQPKKQLRSPRQFLVPQEEEEPVAQEEHQENLPKKGRAQLRKQIKQKKEQGKKTQQGQKQGQNPFNGLVPGLAGLDLAKQLIVKSTDKLVLKAPRYKVEAEKEGAVVRSGKKTYTKAEKTEKYLYNGIPERKEDGIGCFGCMAPKGKTFKASEL